MKELYQVDMIAISVLAESLKADFNYLLNRELAEAIARSAIQRIAFMQEYSGGKVWRKAE